MAQLEKLPEFVKKRRYHAAYLKERLQECSEKVILPEENSAAISSPFGLILTCKEGVSREKIVSKLEENGIQTRPLFAGNLLLHPCFDHMRESGTGFRVIGDLPQTQKILTQTFWVGVYPGLTQEQLAYEGEMLYAVIRAV